MSEYVSEMISEEIAESLGEITSLRVKLDLGVIKVRVESAADAGYAVQGRYTTAPTFPIKVRYYVEGDTGYLAIEQKHLHRGWYFDVFDTAQLELRLTDRVPVHLKVDVGVGKTDLDLGALTVNHLKVEGGVGKFDLVLPRHGEPEIDIEGGVGSMDIRRPDGETTLKPRRIDVEGGVGKTRLDLPAVGAYPVDVETGVGQIIVGIPDGLAAHVRHRGASFLSRLDIRRPGMTCIRQDEWQTAGYSVESANRADITIEAGIGQVIVR